MNFLAVCCSTKFLHTIKEKTIKHECYSNFGKELCIKLYDYLFNKYLIEILKKQNISVNDSLIITIYRTQANPINYSFWISLCRQIIYKCLEEIEEILYDDYCEEICHFMNITFALILLCNEQKNLLSILKQEAKNISMKKKIFEYFATNISSFNQNLQLLDFLSIITLPELISKINKENYHIFDITFLSSEDKSLIMMSFDKKSELKQLLKLLKMAGAPCNESLVGF